MMFNLISFTLFPKRKQNPKETQPTGSMLALSPLELWGLLLIYSPLILLKSFGNQSLPKCV